ncbi:MAG: HindIII family type II restriction endonuclease [Planctomycetia bacterium]|nr:HindIII family type II restriction endonuclease [Planctomycetia bacterium]
MDFPQLLSLITEQAQSKTETFVRASENIQRAISQLDEESMLNILYNIGSIPESLPHDSTEEKLFAKAADIILAEAFNRLGFQAETYRERANCADVCGISVTEGYSFVADAKTFRMSRTAKNQKDFKVKALSEWRRNSDYAILVVPYFQYPRSQSQVYQQAIDSNVCLLSWEHLTFMLKNHISETSKMRLKAIWNISDTLSTLIVHANLRQRENFIHANRSIFCETIGLSWDSWLHI